MSLDPAQALDRYGRSLPDIPWRLPIPVSVAGRQPMLCCRVCIALDGLQGRRVWLADVGFADAAAHAEHMRTVHQA